MAHQPLDAGVVDVCAVGSAPLLLNEGVAPELRTRRAVSGAYRACRPGATRLQLRAQLPVQLQVLLVLAQLLRVHLRRRRGRKQRQRVGAACYHCWAGAGGGGGGSGSSPLLQRTQVSTSMQAAHRGGTHRSVQLSQPLRTQKLVETRPGGCACRRSLLRLLQAVCARRLRSAARCQRGSRLRQLQRQRTRCLCSSERILPRFATCCGLSSTSGSDSWGAVAAARAGGGVAQRALITDTQQAPVPARTHRQRCLRGGPGRRQHATPPGKCAAATAGRARRSSLRPVRASSQPWPARAGLPRLGRACA